MAKEGEIDFPIDDDLTSEILERLEPIILTDQEIDTTWERIKNTKYYPKKE